MVNRVRLHPNDQVAIVSIAYDIATGLWAWYMGATVLALAIVAGGITIVGLFDYWENRRYRKGATISWLDWMHTRDLMNHGQNYEAVIFVLRKAYNLTEQELLRLKPEDLDGMLHKLKVKQDAN